VTRRILSVILFQGIHTLTWCIPTLPLRGERVVIRIVLLAIIGSMGFPELLPVRMVLFATLAHLPGGRPFGISTPISTPISFWSGLGVGVRLVVCPATAFLLVFSGQLIQDPTVDGLFQTPSYF
jgi:hypothetical protein